MVSGAYTASLALANGCTGSLSSSVTSSGVADGGGGSQADGTSSGIGVTGAGAGAGVGLLAGVRASVGGSGSQAFWARVRTPGASSWACRANSSFSSDRIHSSEESWRMLTVGLGDTSSKSALVVEVETGFCQCHLSRSSLKVFLAMEPGIKCPPGNVIWPSPRSIHFLSRTYSLSTLQLLFQWSPPQK